MALPGKPTIVTPSGGLADARTFRFKVVSSPAMTAYHIQVNGAPDMLGTMYWNTPNASAGIVGGSKVVIAYGGTALPVGPTVWWRARAANAEGNGPWSTTAAFTVDSTPPAVRDPYDEWSGFVLGEMSEPRTMYVPGRIRPHGAAVAPLVTSEMGARWRLHLPDRVPPIFADLELVGMTAEVTPAGWTLSAVTGRVPSQGGSGDYLARVMTTGPLAHWRLGEPTGAIALPYLGTTQLVPGGAGNYYIPDTPWGAVGADEPDGSMWLSGATTAYLSGGDVCDFPGTAPFTFAAWLRIDIAATGRLMRVISKEGATGYSVWVGDTVALRRFDATGVEIANGPGGMVLPGQWLHFVAIYDGWGLVVIVNNVWGASVANPRTLPGNTASWTVGRISDYPADTAAYLTGVVDELTVWTRALNGAEVAYLYGAGPILGRAVVPAPDVEGGS